MTGERSRRLTRHQLLQALATGASALGIASLLEACGQGAPAADSDPPTAALPEAPAATISPQNTITVQFGDADQGLLRALQSGAGLPDVSVFFSGNAGAIAERGGLHDLSMALRGTTQFVPAASPACSRRPHFKATSPTSTRIWSGSGAASRRPAAPFSRELSISAYRRHHATPNT